MIAKNYYTIDEVSPGLIKIYDDLDAIKYEVENIKNEIWPDWPETELYDNKGKNRTEWNIYPFMAFDVTVYDNCKKCPKLWNFIQNLPGIRVALLSRLGPGTKLNSHRGWGNHSNHVIRCHFGIKIPEHRNGCYVSVKENKNDDEEIQFHEQDQWLLFDDSRYHYAHNPTDQERIVLIIDINRPSNIKPGTSDIGDTKELLQIVDYFRQNNLRN